MSILTILYLLLAFGLFTAGYHLGQRSRRRRAPCRACRDYQDTVLVFEQKVLREMVVSHNEKYLKESRN